MRLYLVRWADLSASIVSARNREEALDIIDQHGDPGSARVEPFKGPLWLHFDAPVALNEETASPGDKLHAVDHIKLSSLESLREGEVMLHSSDPQTEQYDEMMDAVMAGAWPHLYAVLNSEQKPSMRKLLDALDKELEPLAEHLKLVSDVQERTDLEGEWMKRVGRTLLTSRMRQALEEGTAMIQQQILANIKPEGEA